MQRISLGFLLLVLLAAGSCPGRADGGLACDLPADLILPADPLTHVAAALAKKNQVDILALGSGSAVGDSSGAGGGPAMAYKAPRASFPYRMVETLKAIRPPARTKGAQQRRPAMRSPGSRRHPDEPIYAF